MIHFPSPITHFREARYDHLYDMERGSNHGLLRINSQAWLCNGRIAIIVFDGMFIVNPIV